MDHLTPRERFKRVLRGQPTDRLPLIGAEGSVIPLNEHAEHWVPQGMAPDEDPMQRFGFDCADIPKARRGWEGVPLDMAAVPRFPTPPLPDVGPYRRFVHAGSGKIIRVRRADADLPFDVKHEEKPAITEPTDWEEYKKRHQLNAQGRYPENWAGWVAHSKQADHPITLFLRGLFGWSCMLGLDGEKGLLLSLYDRPEFVREIIEYMTQFIIAISQKALTEAKVDFIHIHDMLGDHKTSLISPQLFRDFYFEPYKRLLASLRNCGQSLLVFSGACSLLPYLDTIAELEFDALSMVQTAAEAKEIRRRYGNRFAMIGGIDRWLLSSGSDEEIRREVDLAVEVASQGKMIPTLCERLVYATTYQKYCVYAQRLAEKLLVNERSGRS